MNIVSYLLMPKGSLSIPLLEIRQFRSYIIHIVSAGIDLIKYPCPLRLVGDLELEYVSRVTYRPSTGKRRVKTRKQD